MGFASRYEPAYLNFKHKGVGSKSEAWQTRSLAEKKLMYFSSSSLKLSLAYYARTSLVFV